jgi:predicted ribosome quality control (RQC) complex YloA/Tae2 family protein
MITANEARTIISNIKKQEQEAIEKAIEKFLDEECNSAITNAASQKLHDILVEVPQELDQHTNSICASLTTYGFKSQIRFGQRNAILIMW